jgi:zinc transporter
MTESGLLHSYLLDGSGGGTRLDQERIDDWRPEQGTLWVHLNRDSADAHRWLHERSGLDPLIAQALLAESTRPRCVAMDGGTMLFLRGINHNPGADPEDMVSIRLWIEAKRVITVRLRRLLSVDDLRQSLDRRQGPSDVGEFVVQLANRLIARVATVITDIDDEVDTLQEQVLESEGAQLRSELTRSRRSIIALRRYLAPQRDALSRLTQLQTGWLSEMQLLYLREETDRVTRYLEDLDAARERAAVTQEELANRLSEQMNARMYVLSIVAALFLPLGFLTGLLGINVGGIPLADSPSGFLSVVAILGGITALLIALFRWRHWL